MEAGIDEGIIIDNYNDPQFRERIYDGWMNLKKFYTFEEYCKVSGVPEEQLKSIVMGKFKKRHKGMTQSREPPPANAELKKEII